MKYIITESKFISIIDKLIRHRYPEFNKTDLKPRLIKRSPMVGDYESYSTPDYFYFKYLPKHRELVLNSEIYDYLNTWLDGKMEYVVEWFNNEFDRDAESIYFN
jgi:hypothetical protein